MSLNQENIDDVREDQFSSKLQKNFVEINSNEKIMITTDGCFSY